jgi:hypothetical protein
MFAVGDTNQCVIEGTRIKTNSGQKFVEELDENSTLIVSKGNSLTKESPIMGLYRKEVINIPVVTLTTSLGYKLTTTSNIFIYA